MRVDLHTNMIGYSLGRVYIDVKVTAHIPNIVKLNTRVLTAAPDNYNSRLLVSSTRAYDTISVLSYIEYCVWCV